MEAIVQKQIVEQSSIIRTICSLVPVAGTKMLEFLNLESSLPFHNSIIELLMYFSIASRTRISSFLLNA